MKLPHRRQPLKASASDRAIDTHDRRRTVITAEGLRLPFLLASRAARAGALAMDLVLIVLLMAGTTVLLVWLAHAIKVDLTRIGQKGGNGPGLTFEVLAVFSATPISCFSNWARAARLRASGWQACASRRGHPTVRAAGSPPRRSSRAT
jgi:hypothetical protein